MPFVLTKWCLHHKHEVTKCLDSQGEHAPAEDLQDLQLA